MKHTTFTALREAGVSRDDIQALARHRDPGTTDIYDLSAEARRGRALDALDQLERGRQTGDRTQQSSKTRKPVKLLDSRPGSMVGVVGFEPSPMASNSLKIIDSFDPNRGASVALKHQGSRSRATLRSSLAEECQAVSVPPPTAR